MEGKALLQPFKARVISKMDISGLKARKLEIKLLKLSVELPYNSYSDTVSAQAALAKKTGKGRANPPQKRPKPAQSASFLC